MNLKNMKVGTRLALGYAIVLVLLLIIVGAGVMKMREMQERIQNITEFNNTQIRQLNTAQDSVADRMIALRNLALLTDENAMRLEAERLRKQEALYAEEMGKVTKSLEDPSTDPKEKSLMATIVEQDRIARPLMAETEKLGLANQAAETTSMLMDKVRPVQRVWMNTIDELITLEEGLNEEEANEAKDAYHTAVRLMLILAVVALVVGITAAVLITRTLLKQLGGEPTEAAAVLARIADGDLTVDVPVKAGDTASMMFAMRTMRDKLAAIVAEVRTGTDTIATAAAEVSAGNQDLSSRTEEQASSLEETASSMEELTSTVRQNAENAQQASAMAASASSVAAQGGSVVAQVVDTMGAIDASAKKIVDIISVIDGIAFQTNILALNAAVEAARAGEQGRGFAVVAGEVRNLAHRSASAAKEIKALIDDSVEKVGVGTQLVGQAGATMNEVVGSVQRVTDIMAEISSASREQSSGIDQVNVAITQMDEVTQQNAALVEEASAASEAMQEQARRLAELVGTFTLAQGTAPAPATRKAIAPSAPAKQVAKVAAKPAALPSAAGRPAVAKAAPVSRKAPVTAGSESDWEEF
ncbi:methyl-accepting chemotaxis protein [Pseudoduganella sp. SL102]|uniref:methyl-accepting chemotaxis protein n=1 Tax=Pseudoduganella sp. SL102 TaxID=2995154 RepID=UPI00248B89E1|nr:methyl-accepting chemotaxis protein [Pseudoduganella sp. SL102]WBS01931.1 methyl-accepting chemotaxis protein [Pseudoduganella sp. SL102]